MHRYCSACNGSAAYLDLSAFRSVPRVLKQAICFVGWDRYKALGSMSDMGIFANDAPKPFTIENISRALRSCTTRGCGMKLQWLCLAMALACCSLMQSVQAQERTDPCKRPVPSPATGTMKLTLKSGQSVYHEGEIIPLRGPGD